MCKSSGYLAVDLNGLTDLPFAPSPGLYFLIHRDVMAHPDTQIIPRFACSLENRGPVGLSQRTHIHHCNNVVGIPDILAPPKKIRKPFPGRYPNSRAFHCDVVEKADGLGLTSQIIFHPLLPWKLTRCHVYLNAGPAGPRCGILTSTSECSRRHNHAISPPFV